MCEERSVKLKSRVLGELTSNADNFSADAWDNILSHVDLHYCDPTDRQSLLRCWTSLGRDPKDLYEHVAEDFEQWKGVKARGGKVLSICWRGESV